MKRRNNNLIRLTFGGVGLGLLIGMVFTPIIKFLHNDKLVVVFSFLASYLTFFLAESSMTGFHVSGILAVVVLGLYMGAFLRPKLNPHYLHTLHAVWGFAGFLMETLLFLLTGGYIGIFLRDNLITCLLYTSPSPRDKRQSRMPSSA